MARFYNTSRTDFGDYIDEFSQRRKPGAESVSSALGGIDVLPEDRGRLEEIVNGYDQKINDFTRQIQQNPSVLPTLKGQMQDVGQNLRNDFFYGEIAAMRDRVKTHKEKVDYINEALKDDPQLQSLALQRIQVNPLDYDPATRTYGKVDAPTVVAPFTQKEKQDWATKAASTVKEDILSRVDKTRKLDKYTSLLELGEEVGVTKDKAIESLVSQVTPDMIRSEQQKADYLGLGINEGEFYKDGKLNLNTTYGRLINGIAEGLAHKKSDTKNIQYEDKAGLAKLNDALQRGRMKYGKELDNPEAEFLAQKVIRMWEGDESAYLGKRYGGRRSTPQEGMGPHKDNSVPIGKILEDNLTDINVVAKRNGIDIKKVNKTPGNVPIITYTKQEPVYKEKKNEDGSVSQVDTGKKEEKEYTVPMNANFFRSILPEKSFGMFMQKMNEKGALNEANDFNIDFAKDVGQETSDTPVGTPKHPGQKKKMAPVPR